MTAHTRTLHLDFLYLDLSHCRRCAGTRAALEEALAAVGPALATLAIQVELRETHVTSISQAQALAFTASPTVRVDDADVQPAAHLSRCAECGDLCNCSDGVDCREWAWRGARFTEPPAGLLVEAILRAAIRGSVEPEDARPRTTGEGVEKFLAARAPQTACCGQACAS